MAVGERRGNGNGVDDDPYLAAIVRAERGSAAASGGSVHQTGVSEKTLILFLLAPLCVTLAASVVAAWYAGYAGGNAVATANGALALAQISERNAKLAQYQLEEAVKAAHIEIPKEKP